jgi:hypothetical protein
MGFEEALVGCRTENNGVGGKGGEEFVKTGIGETGR